MTEAYRAVLLNPVQAHTAIDQGWKLAKALLMAGHRLTLTIKSETRSEAQNRRYWGNGVLAQIAQQASVNGRRYSAETWHEQFKRQFIGVEELPSGQVVGKSSKKLSRAAFSEFCEQVEAYAASELGVTFYELEEA